MEQSTDFKVGFQAGALLKIPFENILSFSPALSYKLMGYKVAFNRPSYPPDLLAKDNNTTFHELDVDLLLHFDLSNKPSHLFIRTGPSFDFVLWGKEKYNLATGESVDRNMKFSLTSSYCRYDASIVLQFGFESSTGFMIYANHTHGLISMDNEERGPSIRKYLFGITVGKFLKSKKN